jgi:hypothetical protein
MFIANESRNMAAPTTYSCKSGRFLGIDSLIAEDEISLSRAVGFSSYEIEQKTGVELRPGIMNMIRTSIGEVGKRPGKRVFKKLEFGGENVTVLATVFGTTVQSQEPFLVVITRELGGGGYYGVYASVFLSSVNDSFDNASYYHIREYTSDLDEPNCVYILNNVFYGFFDGQVVVIEVDDSASNILSADIYTASGAIDLTAQAPTKVLSIPAYERVYLPTVSVGGTPSGAGTGLEPVNLLNPFVCERFAGDGSSKEFLLSVPAQDSSSANTIKAQVLNESGQWETVTGVTIQNSKAVFAAAPAKSPVTGEDNIQITYLRSSGAVGTGYGYISYCRCYCNFGAAGYKDRVFVSANSEQPNRVWYSGMDKPLYFGDIFSLDIGNSDIQVKGLAGQDTRLAVITSTDIYLVEAKISAQQSDGISDYALPVIFVVSATFPALRPIGYKEPVVFGNEVVYLSEGGVCAITTSGIMDERYAQIRSALINGWLLYENLENCSMGTCGDFLVINNGEGRLYLLDGKQFSKEQSEPFSYRQFEGFIWEDILANYIWYFKGKLYFIGEQNAVYEMDFKAKDIESFNDQNIKPNGDIESVPIKAYWETPYIYGQDFYKTKVFTHFALLLKRAFNENGYSLVTGVRVMYKKGNKPWKVLKDYDLSMSYFSFLNFDFANFTFKTSISSFTVSKKIKIKKEDCIKFRFENSKLNQPFYLQEFGLEYVQK